MKQRNETGRPPVLDEVKKGEICAIVAVGCSRATAARYVGCHPDTIRNTAQRDEEFAQALERAESKHEVLHLSYINKAASGRAPLAGRGLGARAAVSEPLWSAAPDELTLEQVAHVLSQFAGVVLDEVTDAVPRQRILARLAELTASLQASAEKGADT